MRVRDMIGRLSGENEAGTRTLFASRRETVSYVYSSIEIYVNEYHIYFDVVLAIVYNVRHGLQRQFLLKYSITHNDSAKKKL